MPLIRLTQSTYRKLEVLARPFVETPEDVIKRLVDEALRNKQDRDEFLAASRNGWRCGSAR